MVDSILEEVQLDLKTNKVTLLALINGASITWWEVDKNERGDYD